MTRINSIPSEPIINTHQVCVIAGEASGDAQGALLVQALKEEFKNHPYFSSQSIEFWGASGPLLLQQGVVPIVRVEDLSVMGASEVIPKFFSISRAYKKLLERIRKQKPLAVIFIDYPGFNLRLLQEVYALGVTTIYHIPPKAWSHGESRTEILKKYSYLVTSILPFEQEFFHSHQVNIQFIGNPLKDKIDEYRAKNPFPKDPNKIGILPGSRENEIKKLLPILIESFVALQKEESQYVAHIPVAVTVDKLFMASVLDEIKQKLNLDESWFQEKIKIGYGNAYEVLNTSIYAWVCSGTATLETAFFQTPMSVMYKVSPLTAFLAKKFLKVKYVSLVNLCTNSETIPEFLQENASSINLVKHALSILKNENARLKMMKDLEAIASFFPNHAAKNAAHEMVQCMMNFNLPVSQKFHLHAKALSRDLP